MSRRLSVLLILFCCLTVGVLAAKQKFTLVIDAGHGGKDAGALGKYSKEKNINLNVALAFGRYVEQNCPDVRVIYTRKTDVFIPLHERAAIANRNKADVFISIHTNAVASRRPISGLETYTMGMRRSDEKLSAAMRENDVVLIEDDYKQHYSGFDPRSPESYIIFEMINDANMLQSVELAKSIQRQVCRTANRPNKGVKQDAFLVLRETSMPACLIELGYITTPSEEAYLNNKSNVDVMGKGIYQAFVEYKAKAQGKTPPVSQDKNDNEATHKEQPAQQDTTAEKNTKEETPKDSSKENPKETPKETPKDASAAPKDSTAAPQNTATAEPSAKSSSATPAPKSELPVFKVQFMASSTRMKDGDKRFKGLKNVDCYKEGEMWKYTVGCTSDYSEIKKLRTEVVKTFPQAFIIAFKNGEKMDVQQAIKEVRK